VNLNDVFIVIVLYKKNLNNSETISSLTQIKNFNFNILIYDNSPTSQYANDRFVHYNLNIHYISDTGNPGLSTAYNHALKQATFDNKKWLLLLDQDTYLTSEYFMEFAKLKLINVNIVSIIPRVNNFFNKKPISPSKMFFGMFCRPLNVKSGIISKKITAINSGTFLSVNFLNQIQGFSNLFKLDYLDHWYFREIYKRNYSIYLMDTVLLQELSVGSNNYISIERYRSLLHSQLSYVSLQGVFKLFFFKIFLFLKIIFLDKRISICEAIGVLFNESV
jgi:GT2 family glycosyltransferase